MSQSAIAAARPSIGTTAVAVLLCFNGGFVDSTGFLGLQGLFPALVTGNFVTLAATLVTGAHGAIPKLLVLPEFVLVVALARMGGALLRARRLPDLPILLLMKVLCLLAFFAAAVTLGPFQNTDTPAAILTAFAGVAGMAIQNAVQRVHFANFPPTTMMTGNTTQLVLDGVDLLFGLENGGLSSLRARFERTVRAIVSFACGCALAAALYSRFGFWCLAVPVIVGATTAILQFREYTPSGFVPGPVEHGTLSDSDSHSR